MITMGMIDNTLTKKFNKKNKHSTLVQYKICHDKKNISIIFEKLNQNTDLFYILCSLYSYIVNQYFFL